MTLRAHAIRPGPLLCWSPRSSGAIGVEDNLQIPLFITPEDVWQRPGLKASQVGSVVVKVPWRRANNLMGAAQEVYHAAMENRSVPTDIILPHLAYNDLEAAISWLKNAFGFVEHYRYGGADEVEGAQLHIGQAWIMVGRAKDRWASPVQTGYNTQSLTIFVDDVDRHFLAAKSADATIVEELNETVYGERQYGALDIEGHHWLFSRHARDVSPEEWGATIAS
jgi:uncharacterized glyoxalase superfamily protein PhnB